MKSEEVAEYLTANGVRSSIFAIDTVAANGAVVLYREAPDRWSVFYIERGMSSDEKLYSSEEEACRDIIERVLAMEQHARAHGLKPFKNRACEGVQDLDGNGL